MKVKCKEIINEHTQQHQEMSPWLTIGKEYIVLGIDVRQNKNYYLIIDDSSDRAPGLHYVKQFEVTSHYIPSNWCINPSDIAIAMIGPKAWEEDPMFWEKCYEEGDHDALEIYKREARIIMEEEYALENKLVS